MFSGNVVAVQAVTTLTLTGDELGNQLIVRSGNQPGEVIVQGVAGTQVNGTNRPWVFDGVERISARLNGGNDWFKVANLTLTATALAELSVDGGTGDDQIVLNDTTIEAGGGVGVTIWGDLSTPDTSPTTGNDTIQIARTTILADRGSTAGASLQIYGEQNFGSDITGGNDRITVTDTTISATGVLVPSGIPYAAHLQIFGDYNYVVGPDVGGTTTTVGEGNDVISVTNTTISSMGGAYFNPAYVDIFGDYNLLQNPGSVGGDATSTVGGGNDSISVTNTTVSTTGGFPSDFSAIDVIGDANQVFNMDFATGSVLTGRIGGGNDSILVANVAVSATGEVGNNVAVQLIGDLNFSSTGDTGSVGTAVAAIGEGNDSIAVSNVALTAAGAIGPNIASLTIYGDLNYDFASSGGAVIGRGNDLIAVTNSTITGTGTGPNTASLYIYGEFGFSDSGLAPVGEGDDIVALRYVDLESDYSDVAIDTGSGDDALYVLNSSFGQLVATVGDGNDVVRFDSNTFLASSLDGGPGYDLLSAHDNIGVLTYANFEKVSGTP